MLKLASEVTLYYMKNLTSKYIQFIPTLLFIIFTLSVSFKLKWINLFDCMLSLKPNKFELYFFENWTKIGNSTPFTVITAIIVIYLILKKHWNYAGFFLANVIIGINLNHIIKIIIKRPRPINKLIEIGGYSFPSGHAIASVLLFGSLIIISNSYIKTYKNKIVTNLFLFICLFLLAISRIFLNVHYPSDVVAGLLLGIIVLQFDYMIFIKEFRTKHVKKRNAI